jgi:hypothetical protein
MGPVTDGYKAGPINLRNENLAFAHHQCMR